MSKIKNDDFWSIEECTEWHRLKDRGIKTALKKYPDGYYVVLTKGGEVYKKSSTKISVKENLNMGEFLVMREVQKKFLNWIKQNKI